jgi:serine/threonine-protein kinase
VIPPGTILDNRYEILDLIAEGGMGAVYRARRTRLGDEVAVKVVLPSDDSMSLRERFLRESRASASLHHPNIVSILDYSVDGEGRPFLVMELLTGPSLREEIHSMGALGAASVRRYIPPICAALQTAHDAGILHRDIKPANIVAHQFGAGERAYKLVDFGLAALKDPKNDETRLTAAFMFIGTVAYAAPEQVEGQPTDARTDVYSLAAVVYEMLTGRAPYGTGGVYATLAQQATSSLVAPSKARPDVPPELDEIVLRGLDDEHASGDGGRRLHVALRRGQDDRARAAGQLRLRRRASRPRPSGRDPHAAPRSGAALGRDPVAVPEGGEGAPGHASRGSAGARLRRGR